MLISDTTTLIPAAQYLQPAAVTTLLPSSVYVPQQCRIHGYGIGLQPSAQWQGTDGGNTWSNISGANSTLTLTGVTTASNNNRYRVLLPIPARPMPLQAAILTVSDPAGIVAQPADLNVCRQQRIILCYSIRCGYRLSVRGR